LRVVGRRFLSRPIKLTGRHILVVSLLASATISLPSTAVPRTLPEYNATEAKNHIGEAARVTDKVGCTESRHWGGKRVGLGDCGPQSAHAPFMAVTYSDVIPGPKFDLEKLKGIVVTVTGKIKIYGQTGIASIDVRSTSQIVPHGLSVSKSKRMGNDPPRNRRQLANPDHSQLAPKLLTSLRRRHSSESKQEM
jgi:hypothetical protein